MKVWLQSLAFFASNSLTFFVQESGLVDNAEGKRKFVSILCDHEPFVLQYVCRLFKLVLS